MQKSSIQATDPELSFWHKALDMVRYLVVTCASRRPLDLTWLLARWLMLSLDLMIDEADRGRINILSWKTAQRFVCLSLWRSPGLVAWCLRQAMGQRIRSDD